MQGLYTHGSAVGEGMMAACGRAAFLFTRDIIEIVVINICCVKSFPAQCCCASVLKRTCVGLCLLLQTPVFPFISQLPGGVMSSDSYVFRFLNHTQIKNNTGMKNLIFLFVCFSMTGSDYFRPGHNSFGIPKVSCSPVIE